MYVCNFLSPGCAPSRVWHFNTFRWTIDIIASTGQHKNQTAFKILSRNRSIMVSDNITFMIQRYYAHISSMSFGQIFRNSFLFQPPPFHSSGKTSEGNVCECKVPCSYDGEGNSCAAGRRGGHYACSCWCGQRAGWVLGNGRRRCRRFILLLRVLFHHTKKTQETFRARDAPAEIQRRRETLWEGGRGKRPLRLYI